MGSSTGSSIANILWPFVLLGGAGACIDFLLGDQQQQKLKEWLLGKWVYLEDLRWTTFGNREAGLFVRTSDAIFGKRLFSARRLTACLAVASISFLCWLGEAWGFAEDRFKIHLDDYAHAASAALLLEAAVATASLALSISFTRKISLVAIELSIRLARYRFFVFIGLLIVHLFLFIAWGSIVALVRTTAIDFLRVFQYEGAAAAWAYAVHYQFEPGIFNRPPLELVIGRLSDAETVVNAAYVNAQKAVALFANGIRILIALSLLFFLLLRRAIAPFTSLIWRRIVEHKTGTFTLVLGGVGALASFFKELAAHLS